MDVQSDREVGRAGCRLSRKRAEDESKRQNKTVGVGGVSHTGGTLLRRYVLTQGAEGHNVDRTS